MTKNAYDIRTIDKVYQKKQEEKYVVSMTKDDEMFYKDNCFGSYTAICSSTGPKNVKSMQNDFQREENLQKRIC